MPDIGVLDTSVVIDLPAIPGSLLPDQGAITTITLAELAAGPHATNDPIERSIRQERLQWAQSGFDPLPFDLASARSYGRVYALLRAAGRQPRSRFADLLIASIATANGLPLYTRNSADFSGLESVLAVVGV